MDMSKYKSLFLSDTGEHLNDLEGELVQLEQRPDDKERIHEVFRHLHSVKGMSSSMGYDEMANLAHRLEDLMDYHREHGTKVSPEEVDFLLRGLDEFRKQLKAITEDQPLEEVPFDLLEGVDRLTRRMKVSEKKAPVPPVSRLPSVPIRDADAVGVYLVKANISEDCSVPSVRSYLIYRRLAELGDITHSDPSVEDMRSGKFQGRAIRFRLVTDRGAAEIRRLMATFAELESLAIQLDPDATPSKSAVAPPPEPAQAPTAPPQTKPTAAPVQAQASPPERVKTTSVRVRTDLLDFFVDSVGELITLRSYLEELSERIDSPALNEGVQRLTKVVRRLQDRVMEVRMVSASMLTQRLPRVGRDIARSRGKSIRFTIEGEDVELDRALVEALDTPVLHLLRNAVDHGIESPEERLAAGKPAEGQIRLTIARRQDRVSLTLSDDGRGIDPEKVLAKAEKLGLVSPDKELDRTNDVTELIFRPGFSTGEGVTDISGRGVGLDAVRAALTGLGGKVTVQSEPGRGAAFELDLPLTLAILQVLLVEAGPHMLALPASRVLRAHSVRPEQVVESEGAREIVLGGKTLPLVGLVGVLEGDGKSPKQARIAESVLVGEGEEPLVALGVERITGHREVVLKTVGTLLRNLGPFAGSTVLGDGRPVLILDVDQLIRLSGVGRGEA
jgi:two-component system chemotaxis sensor kinase CheA